MVPHSQSSLLSLTWGDLSPNHFVAALWVPYPWLGAPLTFSCRGDCGLRAVLRCHDTCRHLPQEQVLAEMRVALGEHVDAYP